MKLFPIKPRQSARALIFKDGALLVFQRKRHSLKTGKWVEYYSIPGGGIDPGESPEEAVVRELREEMGVTIAVDQLVAHMTGHKFEHYVYTARIVEGEPVFMMDSEEAHSMSELNQFIVTWVPVVELTSINLRYYNTYLELIQQIASGNIPRDVLRITAV